MTFLSSHFQLSSPAFADHGFLPLKYTRKGENVSPPLSIADMPYGTRSMTLMMNAPNTTSGDWLHWSLYNIPREVSEIAENTVPIGALQGISSTGRIGYSGPNPPPGTGVRKYVFELYALPVIFEVGEGIDRMALEQLLRDTQVIAKAELTALFITPADQAQLTPKV